MQWLIVLLLAVLGLAHSAENITVIGMGGHSCNLSFMNRSMPCSLGKNGISTSKKEGDGCTPAGSFLIRQVFFRADRIEKPSTGGLESVTSALQPDDGWCDDPKSPDYNRHVKLPYPYSHENLWETSQTFYDLFGVIGYNDSPPIPGLGSAIFFHTTPDYGSTAGCVALSLPDLQWVLSGISADSYMLIEAPA
jgi:L,D-peptidoglycan transpeptidase YkuD (ErfK/YbiS/YcfS/YnhG family)